MKTPTTKTSIQDGPTDLDEFVGYKEIPRLLATFSQRGTPTAT